MTKATRPRRGGIVIENTNINISEPIGVAQVYNHSIVLSYLSNIINVAPPRLVGSWHDHI